MHPLTHLIASMATFFIALNFIPVVHAAALPVRQSITPLTSSQIEVFKPYTYFASAGYCSPSTTLTWSCGATCNANPGFKTVASGGDGDAVQYWFVGYNPPSGEVIVSHQGTNTEEILADLTDADFVMQPLSSTLFPGLSSSIEAHMGFADEQAKTATQVLAAVQTTMSRYSTSKVTIVGHSLGAAISLLDSVYLPLHLPSTTVFKSITYGMPRVGNQAFATYVDTHAHLTHINNKKDPIPILPGRFLGFVHPAGEVHIQASGGWDACPGEDNPSDLCIVGDVPNIFDGDEADHHGPYDGVEMGC